MLCFTIIKCRSYEIKINYICVWYPGATSDILGEDSNIFRRDSLYGRFQLSLDWFQVELDELSTFHESLFENYPPSCRSKIQITVKKRLKSVKLLEKIVAIRSYSIPTNVVLVPSRTRYAVEIPCLLASLSCINGLTTGFSS